MFDKMKSLFRRALNVLAPTRSASEMPTMRDLRLDGDVFAVKRKLGQAFFRRRITPRTRQLRIDELTTQERVLARDRGWL